MITGNNKQPIARLLLTLSKAGINPNAEETNKTRNPSKDEK